LIKKFNFEAQKFPGFFMVKKKKKRGGRATPPPLSPLKLIQYMNKNNLTNP